MKSNKDGSLDQLILVWRENILIHQVPLGRIFEP